MKKFHSLFGLTLLVAGVLFAQDSHAQDYTRFSLPDGATARLGKGSISDMVYSPDGTRIAVGSSIGIWLYDAQTGAEVALLTEHTSIVSSVAFSPDGKTLASGSDDTTIRLWNVETGQVKRTLSGHTSAVNSVAFSPDGKTLASGSRDKTILLWDPSRLADWCNSTQTVMANFQLQGNDTTASICRDEANTLIYSFGILGGEPELEYKGPILGQVSARSASWGEGVRSLADLAAAVVNESSTWFDPNIDADAIAKAARSQETSGFYTVDVATDSVDQGVYIFRRGGWEYAISSTSGRPINVEADESGDYRPHRLTVLSPNGKMYHLR